MNCESCIWFLKLKNDKFGGGLCNLLDGRTTTSAKFRCEHFQGKKYNKKKEHRMTDKKRDNKNWKNKRKKQWNIS
jgi:hypothetical protein